MLKLRTLTKRFYHPGLPSNKKLALPKCIPNVENTYYEPVWGNKVQDIQINSGNNFSYNSNNINFYSDSINEKFNRNCHFIPTSHNTPIETALYSCRNIYPDKYLLYINQLNVMDNNGLFINTEKNRKKMLSCLGLATGRRNMDIIQTLLYGIFSNYADSIYIANDYLAVGDKYVIISNYPDLVSQREIEKCRIIAYSLLYGNYPILLNRYIKFEGEANIKFIPAYVMENNQKYQLCLIYDSSRSTLDSISNINKYMKKLNLPLLKGIELKPIKGLETYFYHQDCIINFYCKNEYSTYQNMSDFWSNYQSNGVAIVVKDAFDITYINKLEKIFEKLIFVNKEDDLLAANMIVSDNGIVGSNKISNENIKQIEEEFPFFLNFSHPSHGGGGAHKCCSNVISKNAKISIDEWILFSKEIGIDINDSLIKGVKNEIERIENIGKN
jgi:hypothetical protein